MSERQCSPALRHAFGFHSRHQLKVPRFPVWVISLCKDASPPADRWDARIRCARDALPAQTTRRPSQIATRPCEIDGYAHQHFAYQPRILGPGSSQRPGAPEVLPLRASHEKMDPGADNPLGEGKTLKSPPIAHFSKFPSRFSSCVCKSLESQDEIRSSDLPPPPASEELLPLSDTALLIRAPEGLEPY